MSAPTPNTSTQITSFEFYVGNDPSLSSLNVLLDGNKWGGRLGESATVYFSFAKSKLDAFWSQDPMYGYGQTGAEYSTLVAFNGTQQVGVRAALQSWSNVANLQFIETNETTSAVGDIRFGFTSSDEMTPNTYAYAYSLGKDDTQTNFAKAGDIWFNTQQPVPEGTNFTKGKIGHFVALHEIGHALGLNHSFAEVPGGLSLPNNIETIQYTVMSYSDTPNTLDDGLNEFYPTTPMLYDILAIQYVYGANTNYNKNDNIYDFRGTERYYQTIWDAGGNDTIRYTSTTGGTINLNSGTFSEMGLPIGVGPNNRIAQKETVAIAFNVTIENAIGGSGNDRIIGNIANNRIDGGNGNDTIFGNLGDDTLIGGAGNDLIEGGDGNDLIQGGAGADIIKGHAGEDRMEGGAGDDEYHVDSENDLVVDVGGGIDFVRSTVSYTLVTNVENLILVGIQDLDGTGNLLNNNIAGNDGINTLNGLVGNDTLEGLAGADTLYGGIGNDSLDGGSDADLLYGEDGADYLLGRTGDDLLDGGSGVDRLEGGDGSDTYVIDLNTNGTLQDTVVEGAEEGSIDVIRLRGLSTNAVATNIQLQKNIEVLDISATGASRLNLIGNGLDVFGNPINDTLIGNDFANLIDGNAGNDQMQGGLGGDTYVVDSVGDVIVESQDAGNDTVLIAIAESNGVYSLEENVENATITHNLAYDLNGNGLNNILTGNVQRNTLSGGLGDDTYVVDIKVSGTGAGAFAFIEDEIIEGNGTSEGIDTLRLRGSVSLVNATTIDFSNSYGGIEHIDLSATGSSRVNLIGDGDDNILIGNGAANLIEGGLGADTLNGLGGADTLRGGDGDDTYVVDVAGDLLIEQSGGGIDTVQTSISYTLASEFERLTLLGAGNLNGTGNDVDNVLIGNDGNNVLNGGEGADSLTGGKGNDTYIVDDLGDQVLEQLNEGTDLVQASISYQLTEHTENLTLTGADNLDGTGNALKNSITGNNGNNVLDGGDDIDRLAGGLGNDTYRVRLVQIGTTLASQRVVIQDTITEAANAGNDTVELQGIFQHQQATTLILGANLERLDASATADTKLHLTGNALANELIGNEANNQLDGAAGVDILTGGLGDDTYVIDIKVNGTGAGAFAFIEDEIIEGNGTSEGIDTLRLRGSVSLVNATTIDLSNSYGGIEHIDLSATGSSRVNLIGDGDDNILIGNGAANLIEGGLGADTLNGLGGADTLRGGDGDDTYVVDVAGDLLIEQSGGGIDTVQTSISYTLASEFERLTLLGAGNLNGTGNDVDNVLIGNDGNNVLNGGEGADSLTGGKGNDTYIVDDLGDQVLEQLNEGTDLVQASISYQLTEHTENLTLTGADNLDGTGNALKNSITGNNGNNVLDGGDDIDRLAGGLGNDTYRVRLVEIGTTLASQRVVIQDTITEAANAGNDTVELQGIFQHQQATTLILGANLERLDASATADTKLHLTGNALANELIGNEANNQLDGAAGVDILTGGLGDDTYVIDIKVNGTGAGAFAFIEDEIIEGNGTSEGIDTLRLRGSVSLVNATTIDLSNSYGGIEHIDLSATGSSRVNLIGDGDDNILIGNGAANLIEGGLGADTLNGLGGADTLRGGDGDDTYVVDVAGDLLIEQSGGGIDTVQTSISYTLASEFERLTLLGAGNLNGTGNDVDNVLIGNDGNNVLNGGEGADSLTGGKGADRFVFNAADALLQFDTITDFKQSESDKLVLSKSIFTGLVSASPTASGVVLSARDFISTPLVDEAFNNLNGTGFHLLYNRQTGALFYDEDGTGGSNGIQIALIGNGVVPALTNTDILVSI